MSLGVILTVIFLVLLWLHMITWPLWVCFLPLMIEVVIDLVILAVIVIGAMKGGRAVDRLSRF